MAVWTARDAKTRLSEVIERAHAEGPQTITRHGKERAVLMSMEEFRKLRGEPSDGGTMTGERESSQGRSPEL